MPSGSPEERGRRVAVVGAGGPVGAWVREALEAHGVPGGRVDLFGASPGETVLSEYAGEARLLQVLEPDSLAGHDLVFSCEAGPSPPVPDRSVWISLSASPA